MNCPHCNRDLASDMVAHLADESRITLAITPAEGELFDLRGIGGTLNEFVKLLCAAGKECGVRTMVLLERAETAPDGTLNFHMLIARNGNRKVRHA